MRTKGNYGFLSDTAVVLLNFNGKKWLEQFLRICIDYSTPSKVVLIDNGSTDDSISFVENNFSDKEVEVIKLDKNHGFSEGYNIGISKIDKKYIVLLNTDVEVTKNWLSPIISPLHTNKNIGAVQPAICSFKDKNKYDYAGAAGGFLDFLGYPYCRGRVFFDIEDIHYDSEIKIDWASGACIALRKEDYQDVGGLDKLFFAHMEEIDLCWRIRSLRKDILVVPSSKVYHFGGGTLDSTHQFKLFLNHRNSLLMLVKNWRNINFIIIPIRLVLDGVSGIVYLAQKKPKYTLAIIKAHFSFYKLAFKVKIKSNTASISNKKLSLPLILQYFLFNRKKFTNLR